MPFSDPAAGQLPRRMPSDDARKPERVRTAPYGLTRGRPKLDCVSTVNLRSVLNSDSPRCRTVLFDYFCRIVL